MVATFGEPVAGALGPPRRPGRATAPGWCSSSPATATRSWPSRGAAAVELLHLGTLVHDDIVDGSPLRRHAPTLHVALGMPVALWTADALYAEALHLADAVSPAGGLALGDALRRIADSQILEALGATTARYWDVVDGKTVSLFEAAVRRSPTKRSGGSLPVAVRDAVRRYGRLFQYVDDLQDIGGEADAMGKPTGLDADNELQTLPAADLVVSDRRGARAPARARRPHRAASPAAPNGRAYFAGMTDHLLDAAGACSIAA